MVCESTSTLSRESEASFEVVVGGLCCLSSYRSCFSPAVVFADGDSRILSIVRPQELRLDDNRPGYTGEIVRVTMSPCADGGSPTAGPAQILRIEGE